MIDDTPREVDTLDLEQFPEGEVTPAWLCIGEDGLGAPIRLPLLVGRGRHPGPVAGITAAVHGDELNGIPAIHRLFRALEAETVRGAVVAVPVVNIEAFHLRRRYLVDVRDLNHQFPGREGGREGEVRANRLLHRVIAKLDVLIDLHTASRGRVNSLYVRADMSDPATAKIAYLQRPQIIVHNPPSDGTLRGAAASLGIPAVTVEIGDPSRFQRRYVKRATVGLRAVLADLGMVKARPVALGDPPVVCDMSQWCYTDRGGLLSMEVGLTESVAEAEPIALLHDVFGRHIETFVAPFDGIVVGHAVDPVAPTGARIAHIGRVATPGSPVLSRHDVLPDEETP